MNDHHPSLLTIANFLCVNLDINTPPKRLKKNDSCDSIHTSRSHLPGVTYFSIDDKTTKKDIGSELPGERITLF